MATDIIMPQLGESIAEGTIIKWLVPAGGRIEKDQPLLEVETDKVSLEIPSPASGMLTDVLVPEGQTVPIGTLLARLDGQGGGAAAGVVNRVGGVVLRPMDPGEGGEDHYSPAVRQLAKEHEVDLAQVAGTGAGGRVTKKDVLDVVAKKQPSAKPAAPQPRTSSPQPSVPVGEEILPFTPMRKTIAERMVKSRQTSAHVVTFFETDFSAVAKFRDTLHHPLQGKEQRVPGSGQGPKLTYLPFVIKAVTAAMKEFPILNSSWSDQGIMLKKDIHIGIAVALDDGLLVPVIRHADRKGLTQLGQEVADLAERARTKRLTPEEVQSGTFTITNHGGFGSLFSTPIIHQPQIAILGVGAVQKRAVVVNDAIAIRPMGYLSLSFDHRVIDGATADRFMAKIKNILEQPAWETSL